MSKEQKVTPWFPQGEKPVREGVYEVTYEAESVFAYWNGSRFCWRCWAGARSVSEAIDEAFAMRHRYTCLPPFTSWRGLAQDPSVKSAKKETK